jgi:SAM-dependent methyltransferase
MAADYKKGEKSSTDENSRETQLIASLLDRTGLTAGATILDIGCGPGNLAVPLAQQGFLVTACDISKGMLARIDSAGDNAPVTKELDWLNVDLEVQKWHRAFDLVIAHMTPAIQHPKALLNAHRASRQWVFVASWFGPRYNEPWDSLCKKFGSSELQRQKQFFYFALNYLFNSGIYPDVSYRRHSWEKEVPGDDLATEYTRRINLDKPSTEQVNRDAVADFLAARTSVDGLITTTHRGQIGQMLWQVQDE